ncbi:MAG: hypothetical protein ACJ8I9_00265, partial [Chthoniobacterales bacterium]
MTYNTVENLWLIPAVPLAASLIILSLHKSRRPAASTIAIIGQVIAFLLALISFVPTLATPGFRG